jgi:hypothetical protein
MAQLQHYTAALKADSTANPGNTTLATAVANLGSGNNASGAGLMIITGAQSMLLGAYSLTPNLSNATININSNVTNFNFTTYVPSNHFDAISGLEHELDEVLVSGAGSTVSIINNPVNSPNGQSSTFPATPSARPTSIVTPPRSP